MNDELRDILGEELFNELSSLSDEFEDPELSSIISLVEKITGKHIEEIENSIFSMQIPISGVFALELFSSLVHAYDTGCEICAAKVNLFAVSMIGTMIITIIDDVQGDDL